METIAVFANDATYARHILEPMIDAGAATHWIVIACAPRLTRHIGRFVSRDAQAQWRQRWAAELFEQLEPALKAHAGSRVEKMLAKRPLANVSARLVARLGAVRLLDARRPHLGQTDEPITAAQPMTEAGRWAGPVMLATGLGAILALSD